MGRRRIVAVGVLGMLGACGDAPTWQVADRAAACPDGFELATFETVRADESCRTPAFVCVVRPPRVLVGIGSATTDAFFWPSQDRYVFAAEVSLDDGWTGRLGPRRALSPAEFVWLTSLRTCR
jgi:hypothetical protein